MTATHRTVCVVGAGPRGLSVLERLCANARSQPPHHTVHIHVIDPYPPGPGKVWRTDQSPHLLMNTVAGQISVFTDASVDLRGPLEPGPSLHEWARALAAGEIDGAHPAEVREQARTLGPDTYPTRAFYGHYLRWAYDRIVAAAPATVQVTVHRALATALDEDDTMAPGAQGVTAPGTGDITGLGEEETTALGAGETAVLGAEGITTLGAKDTTVLSEEGTAALRKEDAAVLSAEGVTVLGEEGITAPGAQKTAAPSAENATAPGTGDVTGLGAEDIAAPGAKDTPGPGRQRVTLGDGTVLRGLDAVILCQGHLPALADRTERDFAARARTAGLRHIAPANPADVDLDVLAPGSTVLLRGLGLNFFDYLAQLTAGRGGTFTRAGGRLLYLASGQEPRLWAGSRRGIPYQARGENEKGPHGRHEPLLLTPRRIRELRAAHPHGLDFRADLWPLISREAETVYYTSLLRSRGDAGRAARFQDDYLAAAAGQEQTDAVLEGYGIGDKDRFDWDLLARPYRHRQFTGPHDFTGWLLDHLRQDVAEARSGNVNGPLKAALDVLRDLRNEIRLAVDHNGLHGDSHRTDLDAWYTPLNAHLSIGPPARRVEEMIALIEAGVLQVVGPGLRVDIHQGRYAVHSPLVPGSALHVEALVEARLPAITLRRTGDRLLRQLRDSGQCTAHRIPARGRDPYVSEGVAVTRRPFHLIDAAGRAHPRRFAFGVPTESVHWVTAAGIRPGVNSVTLTDADAIARAALTTTPPPPHPDAPPPAQALSPDPAQALSPSPAPPPALAPARQAEQGATHAH
ncbi:FAD/NAD(P)-binding protein [Streptomyces sp. NPDC050732]|uniref:FAD/NAD(P)-binding protein n=1 Tax=Streptomyces sp. NPDC050732 TaxID=3154632 RepID=UPI00343EBB1A